MNDSDWKLPRVFRPKPAKAQTLEASVWGKRSDGSLPVPGAVDLALKNQQSLKHLELGVFCVLFR